ncbi:MAG: phycobiliprotein lyase [Gloeocapsa sp. UFS-A4-WI-NPMV-4B04]|jgi:hypothetical protein|nr:phycobiliprotein lyase [Gloeocapsa sp. UFS-A4-WI-NPMV-4B04]
MLKFQEFFTACTGRWTTERTYHEVLVGRIERSYTEFRVEQITPAQKQQILSLSSLSGIKVAANNEQEALPGFAIAFDTRSETGETVSMSLQALFVPDSYVTSTDTSVETPPPPIAAQVAEEEAIKGFYLRNEGYSEAGAIAGRFTYQPTRQTLEMTTYYRRSVAVDQMRMLALDLRLRTIVTYQRPTDANEPPSVIDLVGFGVERRQSV